MINTSKQISLSESSLVSRAGRRVGAPKRSRCVTPSLSSSSSSSWDLDSSGKLIKIDNNQRVQITKNRKQLSLSRGVVEQQFGTMSSLHSRRARGFKATGSERQQQEEGQNQKQHAHLKANESFRYKNILSARSVPIVFIVVCFLIIANSRCDSVGSTNVIKGTTTIESQLDKLKAAELANLSASKDSELEALEQQVESAKVKQVQQSQKHVNKTLAKLDPLSILREIYLDHNSKVITMLPESDTVQKFHPNGRYGRRSVDNYVEPHAELAKLIYDDQLDSARSLANNRVRPNGGTATASSDSYALRTILRSIGRVAPQPPATHPPSSPRYSTTSGGAVSAPGALPAANVFSSNGAQVANYQLEMNKLLKCNYTGISNLYWCDSTAALAAA